MHYLGNEDRQFLSASLQEISDVARTFPIKVLWELIHKYGVAGLCGKAAECLEAEAANDGWPNPDADLIRRHAAVLLDAKRKLDALPKCQAVEVWKPRNSEEGKAEP